MNPDRMNLKILLPYQVLVEVADVRRIVVETTEGSLGLLPHRLDCVAILTPGILSYQGEGDKDTYVAVDAGVLVKCGLDVSVSVRDAVAGSSLEQLRTEVENKFLHLDEQERQMRTALAKIERGFVRRFREVQHAR
jgi:F-type H+-transporting ATPase subunit epsilon